MNKIAYDAVPLGEWPLVAGAVAGHDGHASADRINGEER